MHRFITKIGKGQQGAKDLSWEETKQATHDLIESMPLNSTRGRATPCQIGAFLMAMRIKLESVTELAACTATTRSYVAALEAPVHLNVVDVPVYAEKHNTFHVCLPAAIVAAAAGATILFHGVDNPSVDSDLPRILKQLGIPWELRGAELLATLEQNGLAYLDLALYHPPLAQFVALREELGAQNMFHQVARLLNPARAITQKHDAQGTTEHPQDAIRHRTHERPGIQSIMFSTTWSTVSDEESIRTASSAGFSGAVRRERSFLSRS